MVMLLNTLLIKPMHQPLPDPQRSEWYALISVLVPWATIFGFGYAAIYFVFKYFSESRDERIQAMINESKQEIIEDSIKPLGQKIDKLIGEIAVLNNKK
jgi:hypothetical protein